MRGSRWCIRLWGAQGARRWGVVGAMVAVASGWGAIGSAPARAANMDWQPIDGFSIARTETTVGQFRQFLAATGGITQAERRGGGEVYEAGWQRLPGASWRTPFGPQTLAQDDEPAVHVTFDEAQAFCRWVGGRLPLDREWTRAAYTELRSAPPRPWQAGKTYPYPTGESPAGAQCLDDCGPAAAQRAVRHGARLSRGLGHAPVTQTPAGVNGLHDMGGNAWEWVDDPPGATGTAPRLTRGGSWWYGAAQMHSAHSQSKPGDTAVVYIGFRCVRVP